MEYTLCTGCHRCSGTIRVNAKTCRLTADQPDALIIDELIEHSHCVASTADACHNNIRQLSFLLKDLCSCLTADHALEITYDHRKRMRSHYRAEHIKCIIDTACPLTHTLVDGILQGHRAALNRMHLCAK